MNNRKIALKRAKYYSWKYKYKKIIKELDKIIFKNRYKFSNKISDAIEIHTITFSLK